MVNLRPHSIRARTTLAFSAVIGLLLLIASTALIGYITDDIEGDADQELNEISFTIRNELTSNPSVNIADIVDREREIFGQRLGVTIIDGSGRIVGSSSAFAPPWPHAAGDGWRVVAAPIGANTAIVGIDWTRPALALRKQKASIVVFSLIILLAASSGAWALVGRALSPIGRLSYQAHAASGATLYVHLEAPSNDAEIVELVQTLNALLLRLSDATAQRGRFYAAASHELRTPLQALSGHLELAASRPRTAEEYRDAVAEAHSQTRRLVNLTRDLLLLNQLDGAAAPPSEEVLLGSVCDRALRQFSGVIGERNLKLNWSASDELTITAAPTHVEMVVRNLVENAVKYAEQGGEVDVRIVPVGPGVEIFNACGPVPGWLPERTFEPLYRPDASRNSATGGNGLGLTICKAVCDLNHWPLQVSQVTGGVRAKVLFSIG
jgi:signal transduction histidine kinase